MHTDYRHTNHRHTTYGHTDHRHALHRQIITVNCQSITYNSTFKVGDLRRGTQILRTRTHTLYRVRNYAEKLHINT